MRLIAFNKPLFGYFVPALHVIDPAQTEHRFVAVRVSLQHVREQLESLHEFVVAAQCQQRISANLSNQEVSQYDVCASSRALFD